MRTKTALSSHHRFISFKVKASGTGSESCMAVKEDFADEEDYIKAGGSELLFVQMQQNKEMDKQSKLADKVFNFSFFPFLRVRFSFVGIGNEN